MTRRVVAAIVLVLGVAIAAQGAWIHVKATVAQILLEMSWRSALRPWPWADTRALAKLEIGGRRVIVLAGASGRTMAFGPGHVDGSALPGDPGNCVITAHRDTHFAALRDVIAGDVVRLDTPDGRSLEYEVKRTAVLGKNETWVLANDGADRLTLITCYPFESVIPGGPLRYVVFAERVA
ncbi:MAG TPA: class GN sortase [Thermoanaerobaculia bacterium]